MDLLRRLYALTYWCAGPGGRAMTETQVADLRNFLADVTVVLHANDVEIAALEAMVSMLKPGSKQ